MSRDFTMEPPRGFEPRTYALRVPADSHRVRHHVALRLASKPRHDHGDPPRFRGFQRELLDRLLAGVNFGGVG
jgi:hypothetical protein